MPWTSGDEFLAHLRLGRTVSRRLELQGLLSVSEVDTGTDDAFDDASDVDAFQSLDHFRRTGAELRANVDVGPTVVTLGAEVEEERQRSFSESSSSFGTSYGRSDDGRVNRAAFVHATGERGLLSLNGGARLEDNERFGQGLTWQVGVSLGLPGLSGSRLRALLGTAIKEPTFFENFASGFVTGNPDLDPERSRSWEVGWQHDLSSGGTLQATYFDQRLEDLIQYTFAPPDPGDPNYFNVAGARTRGVELDMETRWGQVDVGATYAWLDTEVTNPGFDNGPGAELVDGERLLRRPTHTFSVRSATTVGAGGRLHTSLSFVGDRADRSFDPMTFTASREELPAYLLWSLGGAWEVLRAAGRRPSVAASIRAENLLDQAYEEAWGFAAPGRQLYVGVAMTWGGA